MIAPSGKSMNKASMRWSRMQVENQKPEKVPRYSDKQTKSSQNWWKKEKKLTFSRLDVPKNLKNILVDVNYHSTPEKETEKLAKWLLTFLNFD